MPVINEINLSELGGATRIDPEFYQSKYTEIYKPLNKMDTINLGDIINKCKKGIFDIKAEKYTSSGIPFVRISNLKNGIIDDTNLAFIPQDIHNKEITTEFHENDFALSKTAIPAASLIPFTKCNISQDIIGISLKNSTNVRLNEQTIVVFLNTRYGLLQLERWFQGNIQKHLSLTDVKRIIIPILSEDIQKAVSEMYLDAQRLIEKSKFDYSQAESILLGEVGLKNFKIKHGNVSIFDLSNVIEFNRLDAEYFQVTHEKLTNKIKSYSGGYTSLVEGIKLVKAAFNPKNYPDKTFSYVELSNINPSIGTIVNVNQILGENAPSRAKRVLKEKDVIVSSVEGSLKKVALVNKEHNNSLASTGFFQFRCNEILPEVLLVLSKSMIVQKQLKRECSGTILTAVPHESLNRIIIPLIPEDIQFKIVRLVKQSHKSRKEANILLNESIKKLEEIIENG